MRVKRQLRIISSRINIPRVSEAPCVNMSRVGLCRPRYWLLRGAHMRGSFLFNLQQANITICSFLLITFNHSSYLKNL